METASSSSSSSLGNFGGIHSLTLIRQVIHFPFNYLLSTSSNWGSNWWFCFSTYEHKNLEFQSGKHQWIFQQDLHRYCIPVHPLILCPQSRVSHFLAVCKYSMLSCYSMHKVNNIHIAFLAVVFGTRPLMRLNMLHILFAKQWLKYVWDLHFQHSKWQACWVFFSPVPKCQL